MADGQSCEGQGVGQADEQAESRLHRAARFLITINENESADEQRGDAGHGRVFLGLLHFIVLEHGLAG